jgi:O-acetyl-ADP-ribose deacetylase (regulator of RNase III)
MRIAVTRGRLERQRASALITSANDALVGNLQPAYWRFQGRDSVDGAVRAAGGADLEAACLALPALGALGGGSGGDSDDSMVRSTVRRDIFRWAAAVKRGLSAPVRCPTGTAVATHGAFGSLDADVVVHAVAPDVELAPGTYGGRSAYVAGAADADRLPEELLRDAYAAAFAAAAAAGAEDAACPALGAGVKGWSHAVTAAFGLEAAARAGVVARAAPAPAAPASETTTATTATVRGNPVPALNDVTIAVGECDEAFCAWARVATTLLGPPQRGESDPSGGLLVWHFEPGSIQIKGKSHGSKGGGGDDDHDDMAGDVLPLRAVEELQHPRTRWATEAFVGPGYA